MVQHFSQRIYHQAVSAVVNIVAVFSHAVYTNNITLVFYGPGA